MRPLPNSQVWDSPATFWTSQNRVPTEYVANNPDGITPDWIIQYKDAGNDKPGILRANTSSASEALKELLSIYNLETGYIGPIYPASQFKYDANDLNEKNAIQFYHFAKE